MSIALLCSGQGLQHREMFAGVARSPSVDAIFDAASAELGKPLIDYLACCSDDELHSNLTGQILCVTQGLIAAGVVTGGIQTSEWLIAGYSIGEITAWGIAGVWSPAETISLAGCRARAMDSIDRGKGGLGYVHGLDRSHVADLCARFDCEIAIVNPDRLFIIGGDRRSIADLCRTAASKGALRAGRIAVDVASHTSRLRPAATRFEAILETLAMEPPRLRLMSASDQTITSSPHASYAALARQIAQTIDWDATLMALAERGVDRMLELGPDHALADMARSMDAKWDARSVDEFRTLEGARDWLLSGPNGPRAARAAATRTV
jgi:[acyl-carrier-protein] S-malonyltransferase